MKNYEVARVLDEIADILEMKGVEFKPRAYRNAANEIRSLSKDIEEVMEEGTLEDIPGIGKSIAKKIRELIETGSLKYHEQLKKEFPIDFEALLSVEGIGPKTIKLLHKKLGIKNLDDLEKAAKNGKIRNLEGMGEKTEQKILKNIEFAKKSKGRHLLGYILPLAEKLKQKIKNFEYVDRIEIAGSVRRKKDTIGDIDILVVTENPEKVMNFFVGLDNVSDVIAKGKSKSTIRVNEGIEVDLRVIDKKSFGAALLYFTGSKKFNIQLRKIAIDKNYKLNEYGLFRKKTQKAGKTEKQIFNKLGLDFIEPEMREAIGEIETAQKGKLPNLIKYNDLKGDLQMHTIWSDGSYSIEEMAKAAKKLGHKYIAITDHTGSLAIAGGMSAKKIKKQMKKIEKINKKLQDITILKGAEVNIDSKGNLDMENNILQDLDIVVAGIHSGFRQDKKKLTNRIILAMENENVNIIAHPTGRRIQKRKAYELDFEKIFETSKQTNTFLEINSYPERLDLNDINVKLAIHSGCKLAINTDSHSTEHLRYIKLGIATARRGWAEKKNIINTLPVKKLRKLFEK